MSLTDYFVGFLCDVFLNGLLGRMKKMLLELTSFDLELRNFHRILERTRPIIEELGKLDEQVYCTKGQFDKFEEDVREADKLFQECGQIRWVNIHSRYIHSLKLKQSNTKLLRILELEVQAYLSRDNKQILDEVKDIRGKMDTLSMNDLGLKITTERLKLGWRVPILSRNIVLFHEPIQKLKAKIVPDNVDDDGDEISSVHWDDGVRVNDTSIVVVSAGGGCGKTTLVNILCYDPQIQAKFGENIFYVTVPETPNFMAIVNDLLNPNPFSEQVLFQSNEHAKYALEELLRYKVSDPVLLVLDDVSSDSFIENFRFMIRGYKILVTSRMFFPKYDVFKLDPLSNEDAKTLFQKLAFARLMDVPNPAIDDDIANQMVKCCNKHPHTLSVVGSSLNGKYEWVWKYVLKSLSQGDWILDKKDVVKRLQRTIEELNKEFKKCLLDVEALDEESKQCLLDLGLFPRGQRISACALLDMWVNLYDHDYMGRDTITKIFQLSYRKLVTSITLGEEANAIVNYCEQTFITQKDLLRGIAIHLSSKEPITQRTRLIVDTQEEELPESITKVTEAMKARVLSISTGELFCSRWSEMKVPEVEVLVLNLMSESYTLPHFLEEINKLKSLVVTNYRSQQVELRNFHLLSSSTNLTSIRLEGVVISPFSTSLLALVKLEKLSFVMCKIGNAFENLRSENTNVWPRLLEIEMNNCQGLVIFPEIFCNSFNLKKLSITDCNDVFELPEEFGRLTSLETLSLRSCTKLEKWPESITGLHKLSILDISDCSSMSELPEQIGKLGGLRTIYMKGCKGIHEVPPSAKELYQTQVFCNDEISYKWHDFLNVKVPMLEEDRLLTLTSHIHTSKIQ